MATFRLGDRFTLTGGSLVLLGQLLDGTVQSGDALWTVGEGSVRVATIRSVEIADNLRERTWQFGLVLHDGYDARALANIAPGMLLDVRAEMADALLAAVERGDATASRELLAAGANVNAFDELGLAPLHYAAKGEHLDVVALLLANGAAVNARHEGMFGDTPLGSVAATCSLELARLLVQAGADPTIRGWMQVNALDLAAKRVRAPGPDVYALLKSASDPGRRGRPR